ncbi:sensor histidine kinase [Lysobacter capsici]|uniref:sensor histidine kinase n=1 Tax=Lysobacter capsici TaxID=435897 RepID=UPI001BFFF88B|nr:HAMP domain-containing sensor histidine kinase [Lysobacter capsici]QWF16601.1 HAMP domain-containing histidine kinase [Lysobacter capsici]
MTGARSHSLKRRLLWRLLVLQGALLAIFGLLIVLALFSTNIAKDADNAVEILQHALTLDRSGRMTLRETPDLMQLRGEIPTLWYIIRDQRGRELRHGPIPPEFAAIGGALDQVSQARLGYLIDDDKATGARLKRVETSFGRVQILTTEEGRVMAPGRATWLILTVMATVILPLLVLMTVVTSIATPKVVRWSLRSLEPVVEIARELDVERRGERLPEADVPDEVLPLVSAVNDALGRYDEGHERRRRFLADAAHELRTPIAILNARLESMPSSPERARLLQDLARLSVLAEHLLNLQRLDRTNPNFQPLDLVDLAQQTAANMAPLAIGAGYELGFETDIDSAPVAGDALALERVLVNLVHNAIEYGGNHGSITIFVGRDHSHGIVEISDQGPGIRPEHREKVFERFYRIQDNQRGSGLGLNLVRDIVRLHRGSIDIVDAPQEGARFRLLLPLSHPRLRA